VSFAGELSFQIFGRCCRYGNWGFPLFYSVPRDEFEGSISNYTMTAFFHFLCYSLLAIFRRFVNIRSYILTNGNVDRDVMNKKVNKFRFIYFSSAFIFSFLCEIDRVKDSPILDAKPARLFWTPSPPIYPPHREGTAFRNS
jgi:hypothetical protein